MGQVRVRFPSQSDSQLAQAPITNPPTSLNPAPSFPATPPASSGVSEIGGTTPTFDPYATSPNALSPPRLLGSPSAAPTSAPPTTTGTLGGATTQSPPSLFPNGIGSWNPNSATSFAPAPMRLLYGPRLRYTWLSPSSGNREFGSNDFDASVTLSVPNFLWSARPLLVSPSFGLHLWDGPKPPLSNDLPSKAYDAFIDSGWSTDPSRILGGEVGVRIGLFSDFNSLTTHSLRLQGLGQFHLKVTPSLRFTGGIMYIDRNRFRLIPTAGVLWEPDSRTKLDFYFPRPKFSKYMTTIGNYDVWGYVGAEYGGGAWTIEHPDGTNDQIDINDVRLIGGIEWGQQVLMSKGKRTAFVEFGWVTDREILYVVRTADSRTVSDTLMLRAGFGY